MISRTLIKREFYLGNNTDEYNNFSTYHIEKALCMCVHKFIPHGKTTVTVITAVCSEI